MKARQQSGFTLIELVMVIVILGILSAVAVPQFVNLQDEARASAVEGVAGGLSSAAAINVAACAAGATASCTDIDVGDPCSDFEALLQGGLPADYETTGTAPNCTVRLTADTTVSATFSGLTP